MRLQVLNCIYYRVRDLLCHCLVVCCRFENANKTKQLAIFKPDAIGDFVVSSEAIKHLIHRYGPTDVCLIVSQQALTLAKRIFPDVEVVAIVPINATRFQKLLGLLTFKAAFRDRSFKALVCLRHYRSVYEEIVLRSLVADRVVLLCNQTHTGGINTRFASGINFCYVPPFLLNCAVGSDQLPLEWFYHAAVLSLLFGRHVSVSAMRPNWDSYLPPHSNSSRFLLVAPMAGRKVRDLPGNIIEAGVLRASISGLKRVVLTGVRDQAVELGAHAKKLKCAFPFLQVELCYPADLPAMLDLISQASVVITAESSAAHIATALDKPTLILIGGGHYGWFAPWSRSARQVWLTNKMACFDCNWLCPYSEPFCITGIDPVMVMSTFPSSELPEQGTTGFP